MSHGPRRGPLLVWLDPPARSERIDEPTQPAETEADGIFPETLRSCGDSPDRAAGDPDTP